MSIVDLLRCGPSSKRFIYNEYNWIGRYRSKLLITQALNCFDQNNITPLY